MELDHGVCYRAIQSRDRHFEGRFVVGVTSTGLYCRPGCPARLPRRDRVRFFRAAAAAAEAGFRPCARCRPDRSPSVRYAGTSATVARALRRIDAGALDGDGSLPELAETLGVTERHLRRLFAEHVGASPLQVALTRRLHFARRLLDETALPVTEIAHASGFGSLRRFNDAVREVFRKPPRELRRGGMALPGLELTLPAKAPFAGGAILEYLGRRAVPGVEQVRGGTYRRTVAIGADAGIVEVQPVAPAGVRVRLVGLPPSALMAVVASVRRLFDLDADPGPIAAHLGRDAALRAAVRARPGLRVPGAWDGFELAVRAVLGQQVSVAAATTLAGLLVRACGRELPGGPHDGLSHLFPDPPALARAELAIGLPSARVATVRRLALAVASGDVALDGSLESALVGERLLRIAGIGPWTVQYVAMRALDEPDAFPASDLGVRQALAGNGSLPSPREVERRAEVWRPWRAYATLYLWSTLKAHRKEKRR